MNDMGHYYTKIQAIYFYFNSIFLFILYIIYEHQNHHHYFTHSLTFLAKFQSRLDIIQRLRFQNRFTCKAVKTGRLNWFVDSNVSKMNLSRRKASDSETKCILMSTWYSTKFENMFLPEQWTTNNTWCVTKHTVL